MGVERYSDKDADNVKTLRNAILFVAHSKKVRLEDPSAIAVFTKNGQKVLGDDFNIKVWEGAATSSVIELKGCEEHPGGHPEAVQDLLNELREEPTSGER